MFEFPKISIVTPSYNQADYLEETILSVINQNYPNLEYIIIDGGSTDGSVAIIQKYAHALTYWVSEPDKGQLDAIFKGIQHCTGEIFNWINSDDYLEPNALVNIANNWEQGYCIGGRVRNFFQDSIENAGIHPNHILSLNEFLALESRYHQPGLWLDFNLLKQILPLNIQSHYYFDKILMFNFFLKNGIKIKNIDCVLVNFRVHQESKTVLIQQNALKELIECYESLLLNRDFIIYEQTIKKTLQLNLKPKLLINQWRSKKQNGLKIFFSYLTLIMRYPIIIKSRLYYTILKNEVLK